MGNSIWKVGNIGNVWRHAHMAAAIYVWHCKTGVHESGKYGVDENFTQ